MNQRDMFVQCRLSCSGYGAPDALVEHPTFTWSCQAVQGAQTAYRIVVTSDPDGETLWDSGWVESTQSAMVAYGGQPLQSNRDYSARAWLRYAGEAELLTSEAIHFSTGLSADQWTALWLTAADPWATAPIFRKRFDVSLPVQRARLFATGLGYFEAFLNGAHVCDHRLDPTWTDYNRRISYVAVDVTSMLLQGENVLGAILGRGWYAAQEPLSPIFSMMLHLRFIDGSEQWLTTGPGKGWMTLDKPPLMRNTLYGGEEYDARLESPGWNAPGFDEKDEAQGRWAPALETEPPGGMMAPQALEPIRAVAELAPQSIQESRPGVYVVDFGQNIAGVVRLRVRSESGARIVIRHAEILNDDLSLNTLNLRSAAATDVYIAAGGAAVYEPRFTYHGFRYAEVAGLGYPLRAEDITAVCLRNDVAERGTFHCSSELVNRIQRMCVWTEGNNLHGVPTDCPQRDERLGWLNDLTVRAEEAVYNFDLHAFYSKYLRDIADAQGPRSGAITDTVPYVRYGGRPADAVCSSYLILPWLLYGHYGDTAILARHYDGLAAWVNYLQRQTQAGIVAYSYYGDWAAPVAGAVTGSAGAGAVSGITPGPLMSTGFLLMNAQLMASIATVLGKQQDAARYEELAHVTSAALNRRYFHPEKASYATGSQAANAFMLYLGAVPEEHRAQVAATLAADVLAHDTHLTTGNLCSRYILEVLADHGYLDLAYALVTQETYPSWGYMLACGATTTWERWEHIVSGELIGMASHDHPMYATVSAWFYRYLAGIRVHEPGFASFVVRPYPPKALQWVSATLKTVKGEIGVRWEQGERRFDMEVQVPCNSQCWVELPSQYRGEITVADVPVTGTANEEKRRCVLLHSGRHRISVLA